MVIGTLVGWLVQDAAGPHLVGKAIDRLGTTKEWTKQVTSELESDNDLSSLTVTQRRQLRRWLDQENVVTVLIDGDEEALRSLANPLAEQLRIEESGAWAILECIAARFLQALDPSLSTAISEYRRRIAEENVQEALARIESQLRALASQSLITTGVRIWDRSIHPISALMRPEYQVVPFWGRQIELNDLANWGNSAGALGVRLYLGSGGMGKTRLALQLCQRLNVANWRCGFLRSDTSTEFTGSLADLAKESAGLLIVVDYSETRSSLVARLIQSALESGSKVRLMLLARATGDWWLNLLNLRGGVGDFLSGPRTSSHALPPLALTSGEKREVYDQAMKSFADILQADLARQSAPRLSDESYDRVLYLHMKALSDLQGNSSRDSETLLDYFLGKEQQRWNDAMVERGAPQLAGRAIREAAALVTLLGSCSNASAAIEALERAPLLVDQPRAILNQVAEALRTLYPSDSWLGGVQPDLLGEHLVARALTENPDLVGAI